MAVLLLVLANAFFVASEFGLVAIDRSRVDEEAVSGNRSARRVKGLVENLSYHLSGAQLGITASSLILGFIAESTLASLIERALGDSVDGAAVSGLSVALAIALATGFQMVTGELVPKTVAIDRPYEVSTRLSMAISVWGVIAKPIIATYDAAANAIVRRLGMDPVDELEHVRSREEIEHMIVTSGKEGMLDEDDVALLTRSIRLSDKTASEALTPRVEVKALSHTSFGRDLLSLAARSGHSRFPVYGADADDVVGVAYVTALHGVPRRERASTPIAQLMVTPVFVPESIDLHELLLVVRESRNHLMVVLDEHGGNAGVITFEDILEEIVGEIDDEYDGPPQALTRVEGGGTYVVAGALHHDEVLDACGFDMPDGEFETLAGFVLDRLGRVPQPGARFAYGGWRFEVVAMDRLRIASVRMVAPEAGAIDEVRRG